MRGRPTSNYSSATSLRSGDFGENGVGYMPAVGQEITCKNVLNRECRILVKHKAAGEQQTFANVVQVMPLGVKE